MLNRVELIGNLGADPELSYLPNGTAKAIIRLATVETWTNGDGERTEKTTWHRCVAWGKTAEIAGQYLSSGDLVRIDGKIDNRSWVDTVNGEEITRFTTEIKVNGILFLKLKGKKTADADADA